MATVDGLISDAQGYASTVLGSAVVALEEAKSAIQNVGYTNVSFEGQPLPEVPGSELDIATPTLTGVEFALPSAPTGPTYQTIDAIDAGFLPILGASTPTIDLPVKPSQVAEFNETAPAIDTSFPFPEPPAELSNPFPTSPVIEDHEVPVAPSIQLPAFTGVMPVDTSVAPTGLEVTLRTAYSSANPQMVSMIDGYVDAMLTKFNPQFATQMDAIEAQLTRYLNGGTGLNANVENAIYERARSKNAAEANRVRAIAYEEAAARGFTLPSGALLSAIQNSRQAAADNNAAAAREIVVMQAEMEQKNLQFAVTTSASLRTTLLNTAMSYMQSLTTINGQALEYAKTVLSSVIETYNIAVRAFSAKLDAYKTDAQVYEIKMRGAMAAVELYSAEIKALEALVNVDRARVDVYRARVDALTAYAGLYRSQIEAVLGRASLEKMKMDIYQIKVQAYTAEVQAKNAEWGGYTASIEGESAKVQMFNAQVGAYNSQVNAYKAAIDAKSEVVRAQAISNQAKASQYSAQVTGYAATVTAQGEVARTSLENQRQTLVAFQAETAAAVAKYQVRNEYYKSTALVGIENSKLTLNAMFQSAENLRKYGETLANLDVSSAQIYGQLASSAMAGMSSLASQTLTQSA